jgi:SAM-dependent methyltransferase
MSHPMHTDPERYWNEQAGPRWIACQSMLDAIMAPVTRSILEAAGLRAGERVVDIGCGCGSLCLAAAEAVGDSGLALGVDISQPMVDHARTTSDREQLDFVAADAQVHAFEAASFDAAISRFGVMFFRDSVAAFANIARALVPGGRISFAVWQPVERNPWITWPVAAIRDLLPDAPEPPATDDDAPGPFRFADADHARDVLSAAGFGDVDISGVDATMTVRGSHDEILDMVTRVGPLSRALEPLDDGTRAAALDRVETTIGELHDGTGFGLAGAWWILAGRR